MKTSYKLLVAVILLVLFALAIYNVKLIKVYNAQLAEANNVRKNIYFKYDKLPFDNFKKINIKAGYVHIIQGAYAVHISKAAQNIMNAELKGDELVITKNDLLNKRISYYEYDLIISCPDLESLRMDATIFEDKVENNYLFAYSPEDNNENAAYIGNFNLDSLSIFQDNANLVSLKNNKIGKLKAVLGKSKGAGSILQLDSTNQIQQADIDVREASKLILNNIEIPKMNSKFSTTARISITGNSMKMLKFSN